MTNRVDVAHMWDSRIRIAAVIACYNRRDTTIRALDELYCQQDSSLLIDTHLLDDSSPDGTARDVSLRFPQVTIIHGDGNHFWGGGMHAAMSSAGTTNFDYMLWLNDDVVLYKNALADLINTHLYLKQETEDPHHVIVGSLINPLTQTVHYSGMRRTSTWHPTKLARVMPDPLGQYPIECDTMNGNCVLVPKEVVELIGYIDPTYVQQLGDIDYGYRARAKGVALWVAPKPVGQCTYEPRPKPWQATGLTLFQRWRLLNAPHGWPLRPWLRFMWRYGGAPAIAAMLIAYAKTLLSSKRS